MLKERTGEEPERAEHVAARLPRDQIAHIDELVRAGAFLNRSDVVREAVRRMLDTTVVVAERRLPMRDVKAAILEYLDEHPIAYASDITLAKGIDFHLVMKAMQELRAEGKLEQAEEPEQ